MNRIHKPIPKNQSEITHEATGNPYLTNQGTPVHEHAFYNNRGENLSMKNDEVKHINVGLEDLDYAVIYYFNNIIKPTVIQDGNKMTVKTIYASPERWKSVQADGFYRDGNNKIIVPLIVFKRDNIEKVRTLGNKLDGNFAALYQVVGEAYNPRNQYDKFSLLNNRIPSKQYYVTVVPDYVTITYSCTIFTNYVEQNNKIVEAIEYASDSYWGDLNRWRFKASIDSFATTIMVEDGADRAAKSTFNIKLNGYLIPDTVNRDLTDARNKFYTKSQVIFDLEVIDSAGQITNFEKVQYTNKPEAQNAGGSTSFVGGGVNTRNITNVNNINAADAGDLAYLNTNVLKTAGTVTTNSVTFTGASLLQPPAGSSLPATSVDNFTFFVNGVNVASSLVTLVEAGGNVTVIFNTTGMGYTLQPTDEVIAVGKFQ
jgi:hypothetical protein